jgi:BirA family biotin operon repressor/biotin-[acetyl-CoA-carboxylase] ligase
MKQAAVGPKPLTFAVLRLLADGEFHSGEAIAKQLGVSRASVNNALREAEGYGLTLFRVRGRGYCLKNAPEWLDAATILRHLGPHGKQFHIDVVENAASSNTLLMREMAQGAPARRVLAVEWQSGGRGRRGRQWHSGLGNALTFSLLWRFDCGLAALSGLSLAVGVAIIRALRAAGIEGARLKWPNDVLNEQGAKLGGVLIEAQGDMLGPAAAVIGIGLNVLLPPRVAGQIDRPAAALADMAPSLPGRNHLVALLLGELEKVLGGFAARGFSALRAEWEAYHAFQNSRVRLELPDGSHVSGVARGVSDDGALKLEIAGRAGVELFHAGEISLRAEANHAAA